MDQLIWNDLEKGIRFEGTDIFLQWGVPFEELMRTHNPEIFRNGGQIQISWGKQSLLDRIEGTWTANDLHNPENFRAIGLSYGGDITSFEKFNSLKQHLLLKLGEPDKIEDSDEKAMEWENGELFILLYLFKMHDYRCSLTVGLKED